MVNLEPKYVMPDFALPASEQKSSLLSKPDAFQRPRI